MYDKYIKFVGISGKTVICKFESYKSNLINLQFEIKKLDDSEILEKITEFLKMPNSILLDLTPKEIDFDKPEINVRTLVMELPISQFFKVNGFHDRSERQLRVRIMNALRKSYIGKNLQYIEIERVKDLVNLTKEELVNRHNLGKNSIEYIIKELKKVRLELKK